MVTPAAEDSDGIPIYNAPPDSKKTTRIPRTNSQGEMWAMAGVILTGMACIVAYMEYNRSSTVEHDAAIIKAHDDSNALSELKSWRGVIDPKIDRIEKKLNDLGRKPTRPQ